MNIEVNNKRLLMIGMAATVVLTIVWYIGSSIASSFTVRYDAIQAAEQGLRTQQRDLASEKRRQRELDNLVKSVLAAEAPEDTRSKYKGWLLNLVNETGFENSAVAVTNMRPRSEQFQALAFKVKGRAELDAVTDFFVKFYSSAEHHQIRTLRLAPLPNSKLLDVDMTIEVMAARGSSRDEVATELVPEDERKLLSEMASTVVQRNFFGEANIAPELRRVRGAQVAIGSQLELTLEANDPNKLDKLSYSLVEGPEGLEIDPKTGAIQWRPRDVELGEYPVKVAVVDDGIPPQRSEVTFNVAVVEPRREREQPQFDHATQAYVVAVAGEANEPEVWISLRTTGKVLKFRQGAQLTVGSVKGLVELIGRKEIHLSTDNGLVRIALGSPLTDGKPIEPVTTPVETSVEVPEAAPPTAQVTDPDKQL